MEEYTREPCPYRIADDVGGAFAMGVIGGGIFHAVGGFRNAPKGASNRMTGMVNNIKLRAPITGGQFAAWGGMFSLIDCGLVAIRRKEDAWNGITSGFLTGALLMVRSGPQVMFASGMVGGVLLALIEGVGVLMNRAQAWQFDPTQQPPMEVADPGALGPMGGTSNSIFGGGAAPSSSSSEFSSDSTSSSSAGSSEFGGLGSVFGGFGSGSPNAN